MGLNALYKDRIPITDKIYVSNPPVGDVIDNSDEYYTMVSMLTAMPIDMMVQLDDVGIDFTEINEYELFLILFSGLREMDTRLIFGDLDLARFVMGSSESDGSIVLIDQENDIVIDRKVYNKISYVLRQLHNLEKNKRKPANDEAKEYLLERARKKMRRKKRSEESQIESLIIAMVNTEQFKYDFEGTRELSIYQFNQSVRQVIKKIDYDNRMYGVYAGTVNVKDLSQDDLNWIINK